MIFLSVYIYNSDIFYYIFIIYIYINIIILNIFLLDISYMNILIVFNLLILFILFILYLLLLLFLFCFKKIPFNKFKVLLSLLLGVYILSFLSIDFEVTITFSPFVVEYILLFISFVKSDLK